MTLRLLLLFMLIMGSGSALLGCIGNNATDDRLLLYTQLLDLYDKWYEWLVLDHAIREGRDPSVSPEYMVKRYYSLREASVDPSVQAFKILISDLNPEVERDYRYRALIKQAVDDLDRIMGLCATAVRHYR